MWRRLLSSNVKTLAATTAAAPTRSNFTHTLSQIREAVKKIKSLPADGALKKRVEDVSPIATGHEREELEALAAATGAAPTRSITHTVSQIREAAKVIKSLPADGAVKKRVEDGTPIATGHEREELEPELQGKNPLDINSTVGPFGTKEEPAIIKSCYDKRIVGCPGGEGRDELDCILLNLSKKKNDCISLSLEGKPCECPDCTQYEGDSIVNYPVGPFGTKEEPAIIESYYDKRIVGCLGGEGRKEHDYVCFWLEKGKPRECPVCPQYFELKVRGPGGPPDGHGDDDHHH